MAKKKVYGTIKRGKVKITSLKQLKYLEVHDLPYTAFKKSKKGKTYKKRMNT